MIDYFELPPKKKIKHLSNGQRAQVSLALTLAPRPELLIMDDPTLGLGLCLGVTHCYVRCTGSAGSSVPMVGGRGDGSGGIDLGPL